MACRLYYGDQVGFYLAYLNALSCWLLAPAAVGSYLMWALGTDRQTAGELAVVYVCRPNAVLQWSPAYTASMRSLAHRLWGAHITGGGEHGNVICC